MGARGLLVEFGVKEGGRRMQRGLEPSPHTPKRCVSNMYVVCMYGMYGIGNFFVVVVYVSPIFYFVQ